MVPVHGATDMTVPGYSKPVRVGQLYTVAYPICGSTEEITVGTTRPETMFGDVAIAVNSTDPRFLHLRGAHAINPLTGQRLPIIVDDILVDVSVGTGAVKITPGESKCCIIHLRLCDTSTARLDLGSNASALIP
jgi:valyl-tRNA synthetase